MKIRIAAFAALALSVASGCGGTTTVKGSVTAGGKPVVWGKVILVDAAGEYHQGDIDLSGKYEVADVPAGPVKIGVTSPKPPDGKSRDAKTPAAGKTPPKGGLGIEDPREKFMEGKEKADPRPTPAPGAWFALPNPDKNGDPQSSGLTGTVKSGQPIDIDLK